MKLKFLSTTAFAAVIASAAVPARAAPLMFDFAGPSGTAMFQLDSNPTPDFSNTILPGSVQFGFNNVSGTFDGVPGTASTISFGSGIIASLNIVAPGLGFTQFSSPVLFTGSPSAPTFLEGTFTLINPFFGNGTLDISPVQAAVPEPASWLTLIVGFGVVGVMRGRRQANATVRHV